MSELAEETRKATETEFTLDGNNCAKDVTPRGNDFTDLGSRLSKLAQDDKEYDVFFSLSPGIGSRWIDLGAFGHAMIDRKDVGAFYGTADRKGRCIEDKGVFDLGAIIVHELLGHGFTGGGEGPAYAAENKYHTSRQPRQRERCG